VLQPTTEAVRPAGTLGGVVSPLPANTGKLLKQTKATALDPNCNHRVMVFVAVSVEGALGSQSNRANGQIEFSMSVASEGRVGF